MRMARPFETQQSRSFPAQTDRGGGGRGGGPLLRIPGTIYPTASNKQLILGLPSNEVCATGRLCTFPRDAWWPTYKLSSLSQLFRPRHICILYDSPLSRPNGNATVNMFSRGMESSFAMKMPEAAGTCLTSICFCGVPNSVQD